MKTRKNLNNFLVMLVFLMATLCTAATGGTIYVDAGAPGPTHDGTSWANAYKYLQDALTGASSGDEIRVAEGVYKPDQGATVTPGDREATFHLKNGVAIYGGFGGESTLSGDIGTSGISSDNSYHVVIGSGTDSTALLHGFTITAGNANGSDPENLGGGMHNDAGSPMVRNCIFSNNSCANDGGGMFNQNSSPTLTNCAFSDNSAAEGGGGMRNSKNSSPSLTYCTFNDNSAYYNGGGMQNRDNSAPILTNCTFSGNSAAEGGGGGLENNESSPTLINCTFSGNSCANDGGGMFNQNNSSPTLTNCAFSYNSADEGGGGMRNSMNSSPSLTYCTFNNNSAYYNGGGMQNRDNSAPILTNCTFSDNSVVENGGGMQNRDNSAPILTNCTFTGNSAGNAGGGMRNDNSSPTVTNCILWADTPDEITGGTPTITYSDVKDGTGQPWFGTGCIDADPFFADSDGRLSPWSPCINAGDNSAVTVTTDLDGNPRIFNDTVDMGAYECMSDPENTPPGQDVEVSVSDSETETTITMSFDTVGSGGDTTVDVTDEGPDPPTGFKLVPLETYYDIDTTAEFTGMIQIAIEYVDTGLNPGQERALKLRHYEEATDEWVNITTGLDTENNIIYGESNHLSFFAITSGILVDIDIKPGSYPNAINLGSHGVVPVAILSDEYFDATTVNPGTVELAGAGVAMRGKGDKYLVNEKDVNGDGLLDLFCKVETENLDPETFQYGFVDLTGQTYDGVPIKGEDEIMIVPPEK